MQLEGRLARATGSSGPKTSCRGVSCWVEYQALVPHCAQSSAEPPQRRVASAQTLWPTETALQWEALRDCSPERQAPPFSCCMFFLIHLQTVFGTDSFIFMVNLIIFVIYSRGPICFSNIIL